MEAYKNLREFLQLLDAEKQLFFEFIRRYQQFPGEMQRQDIAPSQEIVVIYLDGLTL